MIPERLSQSIATCRTWLARRARFAPGRILRIRGRGPRPELFVLEDRCLLTTTSLVSSITSIESYVSVDLETLSGKAAQSAPLEGLYVFVGLETLSGRAAQSAPLESLVPQASASPIQASPRPNSSAPVPAQRASFSAVGFGLNSINTSSGALAEAIEYASTQPAGSQRVLVMYANGSVDFPFTVAGYGTLAQSASSGTYTLIMNEPAEVPNDSSTPNSSPPAGGVIVVVPPVNENGPPPQTPESSRSPVWWSQTPHPTSGVLLMLASPNGSVSSVPAAQASTPVALFLLQAPAAVASPSRPVGDITVLDRASDMFALAASVSTSRITERDLTALIAKNLTPRRNVPAEVDEIFSGSALASGPIATPLPAPTRSDLLAMTDKILEEYAPLPKKEDEPRSVISMQAVAACAAVQTAWLLLRHVAIARSKPTPDDLEEKRGGWRWKTVR